MTPVPRIDGHQHFWRRQKDAYPWLTAEMALLRRSFGPHDLRPELEREGITGSILVQTSPSPEESRWLLSTAARVSWVHGVVGWVDLTAADVEEAITELRSAPGGEHLVGIRHQVHGEADPDWLCREDVRRGLRAVDAAGLAFDLPVRTRELPAALEVCRSLPEVRFVLDHLARPPIASGDLRAWGRALLPLAELPNVNAKISGLVSEADRLTWSIDDLRHPIELALDAFGPRRLMLGSDWPCCLLAGSYGDVIDVARYLLAELPTHEQDDVRGGTARRVYRSSRRSG